MEQTIYSTPTDYPHGKFQFLQWGNFLGEFKTEIDKARARANLGIPDSYSFNWGNIGGNIQNQTDLINLINQVVSGNSRDYTTITNKVTQFETLLNNYAARLLSAETTANSLQTLVEAVDLQNIKSEILSIKTNVAQNSTDISRLADITSGGEQVDLLQLVSDVNNLKGTVSAHGVQISAKADSAALNLKADLSAVTALDSRLNTLSSNVGSLETRISALESSTGTKTLVGILVNPSTINATEGDTNKPITIIATYADNSQININSYVTAISTNDSVASYNNGFIEINGVGTASITFTYQGEQTSISVVVAGEEVPVVADIFYIGYCTSVTELMTGSKYQKSQLNGITWNGTNIPKQFEQIGQNSSVSFYVGVPVKYTNVSIMSAGWPAGTLMSTHPTANNTSYNIYKINGVSDYNSEYTITIS